MEPGHAARALGAEWASAGGLAWSPSGDEIWFTATRGDGPKSLWAVSLDGRLRPLAQTAGTLTLRDVAPDGRLLASRETRLLEMAAIVEGQPAPRSLSWLDWSRVADVSADGQRVLFDEGGVAAGGRFLVYLRRIEDGSTVRLGEGRAMALSSDGHYALALHPEQRTRLRLLPLGEGKPIDLPPTGLEYQWVRYFPDGRRLLALASAPGQPLRLHVVPADGKPYAITPPGTVRNAALSPDGSRVALLSSEGKLLIHSTASDAAPAVVSRSETLAPLLWTSDGWLYVQLVGAYSQIPARIQRLHVATGRLEPWREAAPADAVGVNAITKVMLSQDARMIVFNYRRVLSELFVADGSARSFDPQADVLERGGRRAGGPCNRAARPRLPRPLDARWPQPPDRPRHRGDLSGAIARTTTRSCPRRVGGAAWCGAGTTRIIRCATRFSVNGPLGPEGALGGLLRRVGLVALRLPVVQRAEGRGPVPVLLEELRSTGAPAAAVSGEDQLDVLGDVLHP